MPEPFDAAQVIAEINETHLRLERLIAPLSVEQMNEPGAVGIWSVKDVLAHIAFWERYLVRLFQAIAAGETPELAAEDHTETRNASVVAQYYLRPISAVLAEWYQAREELIDQLEDLSPEDLHDPERFPWNDGEPLIRRIADNSYAHEQEHIEQIQSWLARRNELET